MSTFEVYCSLIFFVGFFLRLASGIYPRVEDNCCVFFSSWSVVSIGLVEACSLLALAYAFSSSYPRLEDN